MTERPSFDRYTIDLTREEDGSYLAEVVELPGCLAAGDDPSDAVDMLRGSFELWVDDARESGRAVPQPATSTPNGRLLVRMPKSLHRRVAKAAERDGVSVNTFVVAAVAEQVGATEQPAADNRRRAG